jgi:anti-sigma factor (TIGR02949 family)
MNCAQARFLLYAYFDREMTRTEEDAVERHIAHCASCALRAGSARGLAKVLRSRLDRAPAPNRLRLRIYNGTHPSAPSRVAVAGLAAAILLLIVPLVADGVPERPQVMSRPTSTALVSKQMTGTLVCLECESRREIGLCDTPEHAHETAFCSDDGQVWRLIDPPSGVAKASIGRTMTVEGVAFPQSGFLRASRAGY